eukprot:gene11055-16989_t
MDEADKLILLSREGCLVKVHGLSRPELNGKNAGVLHFQGDGENLRVVVNFGGADGKKALRPENVEPVRWYTALVFSVNLAALVSTVAYLASYPVDPDVSHAFWRLTLVLHIVHYASICWSTAIFHLSLKGVNATTATGVGQLLLLVIAFLLLGDSCYFLLVGLGCYSVLNLAVVHRQAFDVPWIRYFPGVSLLRGRLAIIEGQLRDVAMSAEVYRTRDFENVPGPKPSPPAHWIEIAGVCFELFTCVMQAFQIVLSAQRSVVMLMICYKYLSRRYATPENRTVRVVL